ncbi:squalene monooxygenase SE1-like [Euphorbia lathyris]
MREKDASLPNVQLEQGTVSSLLEEQGTIKGVQYKTKTGEELNAFAPLTIVCDGCFALFATLRLMCLLVLLGWSWRIVNFLMQIME